jgi:hypothetical protein
MIGRASQRSSPSASYTRSYVHSDGEVGAARDSLQVTSRTLDTPTHS